MKTKKILFLIVLLFFTYSYSQEDLDIKIEKEKINNEFILFITNNEYCPVSIEFDFEAKNINSSLPNKSIVVIPANLRKITLARLSPIQKSEPSSFNYTTYFVLGNVNNTKTDDFEYWLPFEKNTFQSIYQGYNGNFSHQNAFSLDFSHKLGTKVFAARGGTVVFVKSDSDKSCPTKDCSGFANKIIILHNDGTLAEYVHLKKNGVIVNKGDEVIRGQLIGYSGSTGWTKGPHLHFSVYNNTIDGGRTYYKTKFRIKGQQKPIYLEEKKSYYRDY